MRRCGVMPAKAGIQFVLLLAVALPSGAAGAADPLRQFIERVQTFTATFEQVQKDESGEILQRSSGRLWLSRPDRFRWSYEDPYEQLLVCDGETIWMYDPDLRQVTVRPARETLAGTPAELLAGRGALDRQFTLADGGSDGDLRVVRLSPKGESGDFKSVEIGFRNDLPARMRFDDQLGTTTEIRFDDARANVRIEEGQFGFEVPPGVDVVQAAASVK